MRCGRVAAGSTSEHTLSSRWEPRSSATARRGHQGAACAREPLQIGNDPARISRDRLVHGAARHDAASSLLADSLPPGPHRPRPATPRYASAHCSVIAGRVSPHERRGGTPGARPRGSNFVFLFRFLQSLVWTTLWSSVFHSPSLFLWLSSSAHSSSRFPYRVRSSAVLPPFPCALWPPLPGDFPPFSLFLVPAGAGQGRGGPLYPVPRRGPGQHG